MTGGATTIKIKGYKGGEVVEFSKKIDFSNAENTTTSLPQIWGKQKITALTENSLTNKDKIINLSVEYQILSEYTAFLAIEPTKTVEDDDPPIGMPTSIITINNIKNQLKLVVNNSGIQLLFGINVNIKFIEIFDIRGRLINRIVLNNRLIKSFKWDGINNYGNLIGTGVYVIRIRTNVGIINRQFNWKR